MSQASFVFGDVHGELGLLEGLVSQVRKDSPNLQLYSVGDLLDRGSNSKGVVDFCIQNGVLGVLGNHELWFREFVELGRLPMVVQQPVMGCGPTLESYGIDCSQEIPSQFQNLVPESHKEWISSLPLYRQIRCNGTLYRLIHGGVHPRDMGVCTADFSPNNNLPLEGQETQRVLYLFEHHPYQLLWAGADKGRVYRFQDGSVQIFGHHPWGEAEVQDFYIALDTGAGTCAPFALSGVLLREGQKPKLYTQYPSTSNTL